MAKSQEKDKSVKVDALISSIVGRIVKEKGVGYAGTLSDSGIGAQVKQWLSTGAATLDRAVGKGIPVGRLTEISGAEASSKTTLSWHLLADTQKKGGIAVLIEPENATFTPERAKRMGIDPETLIYASPDTIEEVFELFEMILGMMEETPDRLCTIVWDSVAATSTKRELDGEYGGASMGHHAQLLSQGMRKLMSKYKENGNVTLIFINQIRDKIGGHGGHSTFGGRAIKFYASVRIELRAQEVLRDGDKQGIGMIFNANVIKNKVAPPFRTASYRIMFDEASGGVIDYMDSLFHAALDKGIINKPDGAYYYYGKKGDGGISFYAKDWVEFTKEHPEILEKI